jgi:hypothetical protein
MTHVHNTTCRRLRELIPAYSLGATDAEETEFVKAHLADCPAAVAELAEYARLAEALLYSAPPAQPPTHLAEKLCAATAATAAASTAPPPGPATAPAGRWHRLRAAIRPGCWQPAWTPISLLALLLLLLSNLYWGTQLQALRELQAGIATQLDYQANILALIGTGESLRIELPAGPAGEESGAYAVVICDPERTIGILYAEHLPPLPPDMAYQVWLLQGEKRISAGLFAAEADGTGKLIFQAPQPISEFDAIGITPEPATGSPGPTAPPVIKGPLYADKTYF